MVELLRLLFSAVSVFEYRFLCYDNQVMCVLFAVMYFLVSLGLVVIPNSAFNSSCIVGSTINCQSTYHHISSLIIYQCIIPLSWGSPLLFGSNIRPAVRTTPTLLKGAHPRYTKTSTQSLHLTLHDMKLKKPTIANTVNLFLFFSSFSIVGVAGFYGESAITVQMPVLSSRTRGRTTLQTAQSVQRRKKNTPRDSIEWAMFTVPVGPVTNCRALLRGSPMRTSSLRGRHTSGTLAHHTPC